MTFNKVKQIAVKYWIFYLMGFTAVFGIKYFYSKAGCNDLKWILAPTAWWVRILSGIPFEYEPYIGYINHPFRFIIAASCSGVQFMTIIIAALIGSFVHRMETRRKGVFWITLSFGISYIFTIFVNGFRIVISIYLPLYFRGRGIYSEYMTPERLHTVIGVAVYFTSLFAVYQIAGFVSNKIAGAFKGSLGSVNFKCQGGFFVPVLSKCMKPMFWYFLITLGIPLINRIYKGDYKTFVEYGMLITLICLAIVFLLCFVSVILKYFNRFRKSLGNPL